MAFPLPHQAAQRERLMSGATAEVSPTAEAAIAGLTVPQPEAPARPPWAAAPIQADAGGAAPPWAAGPSLGSVKPAGDAGGDQRGYFAQMLRNTPGSAANLVKDVTAFIHSPVQTWTGLTRLARGAYHSVMPSEHEDEAVARAFVQHWKDRYGNPARAAVALREDPFGVLSDALTPLTLGGGLARGAAYGAGLGAKAASAVTRGRIGGGLARGAERVRAGAQAVQEFGDRFDPATHAMNLAVTKPATATARIIGHRAAQAAGGLSGVGGRTIATAFEAGRQGGKAKDALFRHMEGDVSKDALQRDIDKRIDLLQDESTERIDQRREALARGMGEVPKPADRLDPRTPAGRAAYARARNLEPRSRAYQESYLNFARRYGQPGGRARHDGADPGVTTGRSQYASDLRMERLTGPLADVRRQIDEEVAELNRASADAWRKRQDESSGGGTAEERMHYADELRTEAGKGARDPDWAKTANDARSHRFRKIGEYRALKETEIAGLKAESDGELQRAKEMVEEADAARSKAFDEIDARIRVSNQQAEITRLFSEKRKLEAAHFAWMERVIKPMQDAAAKNRADARAAQTGLDDAVKLMREQAETKYKQGLESGREGAARDAGEADADQRAERDIESKHIAREIELENELRDLEEFEKQRVVDMANYRRERQLRADMPDESTMDLQRRRDAEAEAKSAADAREYAGRPFDVRGTIAGAGRRLAGQESPDAGPPVPAPPDRDAARFGARVVRAQGRHGASTAAPVRDPSEARPHGPDAERGWAEGPDPDEPRWKRMRRAASSYMDWAYDAAAPPFRRGVRAAASAFSQETMRAWRNRASPFYARREARREALGFKQTEGSKEAAGRGRGRDLPTNEEMEAVARAPMDWRRVSAAVNKVVHDMSPTGVDRAPHRAGSVRDQIAKAVEEYDTFKDSDIYYTVMGMDDFLRKLRNIRQGTPHQDQRVMGRAIKAAEKEIRAQAPDIYVRFLDAMEKESEHFDNLRDTFKTKTPGQASQGVQVLESLWDPRGGSRDFKNDLFESLQIPQGAERIAGQRSSSMSPGVGWRQVMQQVGGYGGGGIALATMNPLAALLAGTASSVTSPRIMANLAQQLGTGARRSSWLASAIDPGWGQVRRQMGLAGLAGRVADEEDQRRRTLAEELAGAQ